MPRCPNCGRETERTEDWACRYCGYPLLSRAYRKIAKTYKEILMEKQPQLPPLEEIPEEPEYIQEPLEEPAAEPKPELEEELAPEAESETEAVQSEPEQAPAEASPLETELPSPPEPEPVKVQTKGKRAPRRKPRAKREPSVERKLEVEESPAVEESPEIEPEPAAEQSPEVEQRPEVEQVPAVKPRRAGMVTIGELNEAFDADASAADARFSDRVIDVTGTVQKVVVKDYLDLQYIILGSAAAPLNWNVRCTFSKERGPELLKLREGQSVDVQGRYTGYARNIILKDCVLVD